MGSRCDVMFISTAPLYIIDYYLGMNVLATTPFETLYLKGRGFLKLICDLQKLEEKNNILNTVFFINFLVAFFATLL